MFDLALTTTHLSKHEGFMLEGGIPYSSLPSGTRQSSAATNHMALLHQGMMAINQAADRASLLQQLTHYLRAAGWHRVVISLRHEPPLQDTYSSPYALRLPLRSGAQEETLGEVWLDEPTSHEKATDEQKQLASLLVTHAALILDNQRLKAKQQPKSPQPFHDGAQHALQFETASQVSQRITSILNIDQLLAEVVQLIQRNFGYYHVHIFLQDKSTSNWIMREGSGDAARQMKAVRHTRANKEGIVGRVGATGRSILVPDVENEPCHVFNPHLPNTKAELAVPLRLGDQILGVLDVQSERVNGLTESDKGLMEMLGNQIAVALNNAQLFREIKQQLALRDKLYRVSYAISGAQHVQDILEAIITHLAISPIVRAALLLPIHQDENANKPDNMKVAAFWEVKPSTTDHISKEIASPVGMLLPTERFPALRRVMNHEHKQTLFRVIPNATTYEHFDPNSRALIQQWGGKAMGFVPLRAANRSVAWLLLFADKPHALTETSLQPFLTLADQVALAIERVQLLTQTQERAERLAALNTLSANITSILDLQKTLDDSVRLMAKLFKVRQSGVLLFKEGDDYGRLVAQYREDGYQHQEEIWVPLVSNPLTQELLATRAPVYISDVNTDPRAITIREGKHPRSYSALLVTPLLVRERVIGSISLDVVAGEERHFGPEEMALAQTVAAQIAATIEKARLYNEATERAYDMETASQVGQHLTRVLNERAMIRKVVQIIAERFGFYHVGIYLCDSDFPERLTLQASSGRLTQERPHRLWKGQGIPGSVFIEQRAIVANQVRQDSRFQRHPLLPATAAEAAIPLVVGGELLGVLDIQSERVNVFQEDKMAVLLTLADQIAMALQNARHFSQQRETLQRLQEVDRLKSEFLASMSHELRTPLNSILGFAKIILRGISGPVTNMQRQDLMAIYKSGEHLLTLINEILDLSKIAAGRMELHLTSLDLKDVCEEVLRTLTPLAAEKKLTLESEHEKRLPLIRADRIRVRQILLNLVSNAIKFTERGLVRISTRRVANPLPSEGQTACVGDPHGHYIEVTVKDTGIGIKLKDQKQLFEAFRQVSAPNVRRDGGTGLGLAIARQFTELHGTSLWVESRYGCGSTFRFTLPIAQQIT